MLRLHIPVLQSAEVVSIPLDNLPEDCDEVLEVLKPEEAPVGIWLDVAISYLSIGRPDAYVRILEEASNKEANEFFGDRFRAERVEVLCSLAGYHLSKAQHMRDPVRKAELASAESYVMRAKTLDKREMLPFLFAGVVAYCKGDLLMARREFEVAAAKKNQGKDNMTPFLALASVYFREGKYSESLAYYKHVLRFLGSEKCPSDVRIGMAVCYFRMGKFELARKAFLRTLEMFPRCSEAMRGMAVVTMREIESNGEQAITTGMQYLSDAFKVDPMHPATLILMCNFLLVKGEYENVTKLAEIACETALHEGMKAEALTFLARSWHARGRVTEALKFYAQARHLDPSLPLPHYGLAQLSVGQNEIRNAVTELEHMMKLLPGSVDALRLLAYLYPRLTTKTGDRHQILKSAASRQHQDPHSWAILGELLAPMDPKRSLECYKKSLEIFKEREKEGENTVDKRGATLKVMNDAAVMLSRAGEFSEALELMQSAVELSEKGVLDGLEFNPKLTLKFNLARIEEASGRFREARESYEAIIEQEPAYLDAYVRLAYMSQRQGGVHAALQWCNKALQVKPKDPNVLVVMAGVYMNDSNWYKAKQILDSLVKGDHSKDPYALLSMGTLNITSAPAERRKEEDRERAHIHYVKALEYYQRAIENSPQNVYAANGIGAAIAEMGDLETARAIFSRVQESAASQGSYLRMSNVWVNLANIHLAFEDYDSAIQVYENALARFYKHSNPTLLVYLARAHYDKGNLDDAKSTLLKAQHMVPDDFTLKFNIALTMQEHGWRTLTRKSIGDDMKSVNEVRQAGEEIARALRIFSALKKIPADVSGIDTKKVASHMQFCTEALKKAKVVKEDVEERFSKAEIVRARQRQRVEEAVMKKRKVEEEKRQKKEQEERERQKVAEQQMRRLERLKAQWREEAELKKAAKKGDSSKVGRKRKVKEDDGIVHSDEEGQRVERKNKKKKYSDKRREPEYEQEPEMEHMEEMDEGAPQEEAIHDDAGLLPSDGELDDHVPEEPAKHRSKLSKQRMEMEPQQDFVDPDLEDDLDAPGEQAVKTARRETGLESSDDD